MDLFFNKENQNERLLTHLNKIRFLDKILFLYAKFKRPNHDEIHFFQKSLDNIRFFSLHAYGISTYRFLVHYTPKKDLNLQFVINLLLPFHFAMMKTFVL